MQVELKKKVLKYHHNYYHYHLCVFCITINYGLDMQERFAKSYKKVYIYKKPHLVRHLYKIYRKNPSHENVCQFSFVGVMIIFKIFTIHTL